MLIVILGKSVLFCLLMSCGRQQPITEVESQPRTLYLPPQHGQGGECGTRNVPLLCLSSRTHGCLLFLTGSAKESEVTSLFSRPVTGRR